MLSSSTGCCESSIPRKCNNASVCHFVGSRSPEMAHALCIFSIECQGRRRVHAISNGASLLQAMVKPVSRVSVATKAPHWPSIAFCSAFGALTSPHMLSAVDHLVKKIADTAHMRPTTGNRIGFAAQMEAKTSMAA